MNLSQLESGLHAAADAHESRRMTQQRSEQCINAYGSACVTLGGYIEKYETPESSFTARLKRDEIRETIVGHDPVIRITRSVYDIDVRRPNIALPPFHAALQAHELWVGSRIDNGRIPGSSRGARFTSYVHFVRLAGLHDFKIDFEGCVDGKYEHVGGVASGLTDEAALRLRNDPAYKYRAEDITGDPEGLASSLKYYWDEVTSLAQSPNV